MTDPNDPATPAPYTNQDGTIQHNVYMGLSKLEKAAFECMNGLLSNTYFKNYDATMIAAMAVSNAKALIKALNKEEQ